MQACFKLSSLEKLRASTIDLTHLSLWDEAYPLATIISVNVSIMSDAGKEMCRRTALEFERRIVENNKEENFQQKGVTDKEIHARDRKLMDLLLDPHTKGNMVILSFQI